MQPELYSPTRLKAFLKMELYLNKLKQDVKLNHSKLRKETLLEVASSLSHHEQLLKAQKHTMIELQARKMLQQQEDREKKDRAVLVAKVKKLKGEREAAQIMGRCVRVKTEVSYTPIKSKRHRINPQYLDIELVRHQEQEVCDQVQASEVCPNLNHFAKAVDRYSHTLAVDELPKLPLSSGKSALQTDKSVKRLATQRKHTEGGEWEYDKQAAEYNREVQDYIQRHMRRKAKVERLVDWREGNLREIKAVQERTIERNGRLSILENMRQGYEEKYRQGREEALEMISKTNLAKADILLKEL